MFSISFRKHHDENENNLLTLTIKMYILFAHAIIKSTDQQHVLVLCFYQVIELARFLTNQRAYFLRTVF